MGASTWPVMAAFGLASLVIAATPGPGVLYIVARTLEHGRCAGLASVAGVALGNLGNALAASLGLAALFAISTLAFDIVRYAGATYLLYLGIRTVRAMPATVDTSSAGLRKSPRRVRLMRDGFVVALLNPKTALFFAAFLPQFIDATGSAVWQTTLLGTCFVTIAACTDAGYVLASGVLAPTLGRMKGAGSFGRFVNAAIYVGLAVFTAVSDSLAPPP